MKNLAQAPLKKVVEIENVECENFKLKRRLFELGFLKGQKIKVERMSALGKTVMVVFRGFTLTMRKDILQYIMIKD